MNNLYDHIQNAPLFDTHEHLFGHSNMDNQKNSMLYKEVSECYATNAVVTSHGTPMHPEIDRELKEPGSIMDYFTFMRTEGMDEYYFENWERLRYTGYGEGIELGIKAVFGLDFTYGTHDQITASMRRMITEEGAEGVYNRLLDMAGIIGVINSAYWYPLMDERFYTSGDFPERVRHTLDHGAAYGIASKQQIELYESLLDTPIHSLADFDAALDSHTEQVFRSGKVAAHKIGIAYSRALDFADLDTTRAEQQFQEIRAGKSVPNPHALQDYLVHKTIARSSDLNMPIQVHTGLLAGNYSNVVQGDPAKMIPLLQRYRNARFDLFHASWPHSETLGAIALSFPNVWIDMCWAWTINPVAMERHLSEWLACVPYNKIFGFGADTSTPINTVGYAIQARRGIYNTLDHEVSRGRFSESTAMEIADHLLWKNAEGFFRQ